VTFLTTPIARWLAAGAVLLVVGAWGALERAGRQAAALEARAAIQEANGLRETIRRMEVRNAEDDRARRSSDPVGELRGEWSRD
jgi:type VI protein secretion system component VasK